MLEAIGELASDLKGASHRIHNIQTHFPIIQKIASVSSSSSLSGVHERHERRPALAGGVSGTEVSGSGGSDHLSGAQDL